MARIYFAFALLIVVVGLTVVPLPVHANITRVATIKDVMFRVKAVSPDHTRAVIQPFMMVQFGATVEHAESTITPGEVLTCVALGRNASEVENVQPRQAKVVVLRCGQYELMLDQVLFTPNNEDYGVRGTTVKK